MSVSKERDEQVRRMVVELQLLQNTGELLQTRLNVVESALAELRISSATLEELKKENTGSPLLVPLGGGTFVRASLGEVNTVIVGIGAEVSVEMELDKAVEDFGLRMSELEKVSMSLQQQLSQIAAQISSYQETLSRLSAQA